MILWTFVCIGKGPEPRPLIGISDKTIFGIIVKLLYSIQRPKFQLLLTFRIPNQIVKDIWDISLTKGTHTLEVDLRNEVL